MAIQSLHRFGSGIVRWLPGALLIVSLASVPAAQAVDSDGDGVPDAQDNCLTIANAAQTDADADGWGNRCDGDYNNDGVVDALDLGIFKAAFFTADPVVDLNGDGVVNAIDLGILGTLFFMSPGPAGFAHWVNPASGDWDQAANWFPAAVPHAGAHVVIDQPSALTVSLPGTAGVLGVELAAATITSNQNLTLLDNVTLNMDGALAVSGQLTIDVGTIDGGSIVAAGGPAGIIADEGTLRANVLAADLVVADGAQLKFEGALQFDGGSIALAADQSISRVSEVGFGSMLGTGTILFAGSSPDDNANRVSAFAIRSGITFATLSGGGQVNTGTFDGDIESNLAGRRVTANVARMTSTSSAVASNGGLITISGATLEAGSTIMVNDGGLELSGMVVSEAGSSIAVSDGDFDVTGDWSNAGSVVLSATPLTIVGSASAVELATIVSDTLFTLTGELDNAGNSLDLDPALGGYVIGSGASITGGTLTTAGTISIPTDTDWQWTDVAIDTSPGMQLESGSSLTVVGDLVFAAVTPVVGNFGLVLESGATLDVSGGDLDLATNALVSDGAVLAANSLVLDLSEVTLASDGALTDLVSQSISGDGTVVLAGTAAEDDRNRVRGNTFLSVGDKVTVRTLTTGAELGTSSAGLAIAGNVINDLPGRSLIVRAFGTTLAGNMTIGADSRVTRFSTQGTFTMQPGSSLDVEIGPTSHSELDLLDADFVADGTVNLALVDGAAPGDCEFFDIVTYGSSDGDYAAFNPPAAGYGLLLLNDATELQAPGQDCLFEVSRLAGVVESASSEQPFFDVAERSNDGDDNTTWCATPDDQAPMLRFDFAGDVTVGALEIVNHRSPANQFFTGIVRLFDAADQEIYSSGEVALPGGDLLLDIDPPVVGVRAARFDGLTFGTGSHCIGEMDVLGSQP